MKPRMFTVLAFLVGLLALLTLLFLLTGPVAPGADCGGATPCYIAANPVIGGA